MANIEIIKGVHCYIDKDGVAQLNLEDVARGLGFTQTQNKGGKEYTSIRWERVDGHLTSFEVGVSPTSGGRPDFIPEPIFYLLAMKAENETARAFQHTIAYDVLPAIRKHGAYLTPDAVEAVLADPDTIIRLATDLKAERAQRLALEVELDRNKEWYSIKRVAHLNGISYKVLDWRRLKAASLARGYGVRKIFDANYGEVNTYHQSAWEAVYPLLEL